MGQPRLARPANNQTFMPKLIHTFELDISPENAWLIPIIAKKFGWIPESGTPPEETIVKHFQEQNGMIRARVHIGLTEYFGEAGKEKVDETIGLYDETLQTSTTFE